VQQQCAVQIPPDAAMLAEAAVVEARAALPAAARALAPQLALCHSCCKRRPLPEFADFAAPTRTCARCRAVHAKQSQQVRGWLVGLFARA